MKFLSGITFALMFLLAVTIEASEFAFVAGGEFESVVPEAQNDNTLQIDDFYIQQTPVTNAEFLRFVLHNPGWQRGAAPSIFVDGQYLKSWGGPVSLGADARSQQPVKQVSWFAASAYCNSIDARLPSWYEWEYVAAASESRADARQSDEWRQQILTWYSKSGGEDVEDVGLRPANYYKLHDLHGLIWEWVDDFNALLVTGDNREQGGADKLLFCGAGAITMEQKENYAVLMRVAMLSSLEASYTTKNLGFRCARSKETQHD